MLAKIILARRMPLSLPFLDYLIPAEMESAIKPGQLALVPFRNHLEFGLVYSMSEVQQALSKKLKCISSLVFSETLLDIKQIKFIEEISRFYHVSPGLILKTNLLPLKKTKLAKATIASLPNAPVGRFAKPELFLYQNEEEKRKIFAEKIFAEGQVLILAPELSSLEKLVNSLPKNFREQALIVSGETAEKKFFDDWLAIRNGQKRIVVGTRQALFLPWHDLRAIFVDDEANFSHKNWDMAPRLQNRDAAMFLAQSHGARLFFLGHTPSVESYYFAKATVYSRETSKSPILNGHIIIDTAGQKRAGDFISEPIIEEIKKDMPGDVFLFLNRKGSAGAVICRDCGRVIRCGACKNPLIYYQRENILRCHFCKFQTAMPNACEICRGPNMALLGTGTQAVESALKKITNLPVYRIDSDDDFDSLPEDKAKIIIGTQFAWNKIDWSRLRLAAFLDADSSLFIPEYKIGENLWYLLRDARYRLPLNAQLFVQTTHPEHFVFSSLARPDAFYENELKQRKLVGYPPFNFLLKMYNLETSAESARTGANALLTKLIGLTKDDTGIKITGPFQPAGQTGGKFSQVILAKIKYDSYKKNINQILTLVGDDWKIDPNPNNILNV